MNYLLKLAAIAALLTVSSSSALSIGASVSTGGGGSDNSTGGGAAPGNTTGSSAGGSGVEGGLGGVALNIQGNNGENLAIGSSNSGDPAESLIQQPVDTWYREIANYSFGNPEKPKGTVEHFTQVVLKNTQKLGLGLAVKGNTWVVAGRYSPPGNY